MLVVAMFNVEGTRTQCRRGSGRAIEPVPVVQPRRDRFTQFMLRSFT
jgi:hypothetical protein